MENTRKIIFILLCFLSLTGCNSQKKEELQLPNNLFKDNKENIIFRVNNYENLKENKGMFIKNDSLNFTHVFNIQSKEYKKNNDVIDWKTFKNIFNNPNNEKKANIDEQSVLSYNCYFEDKNNFYFYPSFGNKFMFIKSKNYEVLGGAYLKFNNKIYYSGIEVVVADVKTFKIIKLRSDVDYYRHNIGVDDKHLYSGDIEMTYDMFKRNFSSNIDLETKYFKQKNVK